MPIDSLEPVRKQIEVTTDCNGAFTLFTRDMGSWWPFDTHSVFGSRRKSFSFSPQKGGQLIETSAAGETSLWGTVIEWDPPSRLLLSWHPGRAKESAQELELVFTPAEQGCRICLTHRRWEPLGKKAASMRAGYDSGWDYVFGQRFAGAAISTGAANSAASTSSAVPTGAAISADHANSAGAVNSAGATKATEATEDTKAT